MKEKKQTSGTIEVTDKSVGIYNPELDKYVGVDLFPEKTARAREFLSKHPIPEHLLKGSSK